MEWREYHEFTKHTAERLRRAPHYLDWANMPNPFRHYEGVPVLDLPADPPAPEIPALEVLNGELGNTQAKDGAAFLSQLMLYSAAVSATKRAAASTYALRVNPSSGNLHPTEFHFCSRGLIGWPDGLYHYRPSTHMAEQRALGDFSGRMAGSDAPLVFVLTSIAWREAWKYRDRAYRYCLHDMGHAWQSLTLAARAMGCESYAVGDFADDEVSRNCALNEDEWPMLIVALRGKSIPVEMRGPGETGFYGGNANRLSEEVVPYPRIERMHAATKVRVESPPEPVASAEQGGRGELSLPKSVVADRGFGEVVRMRRSALDFRGGDEWMTLSQLAAVLASAGKPLFADFARQRFVQLYLYVHRVVGLAPGVYRYWPIHAELETMKLGDQRLAAAALSLGQELAGNACVAFSMIGDFESATRMYGDRGYRYVHFEAGAIGQRMYLASEAVGLRATGIGAFFDDEVHRYLGIGPELGQVVYHFAIGYPVRDPRLEA
ncbi:MAG TPA: SagB/ThcOx family dehydrogenase [Candidatus Acidoferrales bacterium]|nr:SagB/ThcOx family dehydrogenase [Candidatus Acidoferrales bacterium]